MGSTMTRSNGSAEAKFENMATPSNTREQRFSIAEVAESIGISESMVGLLIGEIVNKGAQARLLPRSPKNS